MLGKLPILQAIDVAHLVEAAVHRALEEDHHQVPFLDNVDNLHLGVHGKEALAEAHEAVAAILDGGVMLPIVGQHVLVKLAHVPCVEDLFIKLLNNLLVSHCASHNPI